jgi:hypothetical protein
MRIEYYANGRKRRVTVRGLFETPQPTERPSAVMRAPAADDSSDHHPTTSTCFTYLQPISNPMCHTPLQGCPRWCRS